MAPTRRPRRPSSVVAVLFDLDGVLVETFDAWMAVVESARARRGRPPLGHEAILRAWGQGLEADCRDFFPDLTPPELGRLYGEEFERHLDRVRPMPYAGEVLASLQAAGVRRAVVTNSPASLAHAILEAVGLAPHIEDLVGGDQVPAGKPHPQMLLEALARLGVSPERALMVGDTHNDIEAAQAAGVFAVGYRRDGDRKIDDLRALLDLLVPGCDEQGRPG